jgi:hypothetical protein
VHSKVNQTLAHPFQLLLAGTRAALRLHPLWGIALLQRSRFGDPRSIARTLWQIVRTACSPSCPAASFTEIATRPIRPLGLASAPSALSSVEAPGALLPFASSGDQPLPTGFLAGGPGAACIHGHEVNAPGVAFDGRCVARNDPRSVARLRRHWNSMLVPQFPSHPRSPCGGAP